MFRSHRHSSGSIHTVTLGILAAALLSTSVAAADAPDPFVLVAYSDRPGGTPLAGGDYDAATRMLRRMPPASMLDPAALDTNRCVAYAMTRQLAAARLACEAAVEELKPQAGSVLAERHGGQDDADAALAYSNRAVLRWLSADRAAAQQDLARARRLAPHADFVLKNLAATQGHRDVPASPAAEHQALATPGVARTAE